MGWGIWGGMALLYLLFRLWYDGWRGPLTPVEIDRFMAAAASRMAATGNDPASFRAFLEADDGREFVMLNLVKIEQGQLRDPATGHMIAGVEMITRYSNRFRGVLLRNGAIRAWWRERLGAMLMRGTARQIRAGRCSG